MRKPQPFTLLLVAFACFFLLGAGISGGLPPVVILGEMLLFYSLVILGLDVLEVVP